MIHRSKIVHSNLFLAIHGSERPIGGGGGIWIPVSANTLLRLVLDGPPTLTALIVVANKAKHLTVSLNI